MPPEAPAKTAPEPEEDAAGIKQDNTPKPADVFMLARQQNFDTAAKLLETHPQYWTAVDNDGHTLLHWASLVGNLEFAQLAISKGIAIDAQANNKQTPLMWAILRGNLPVVRYLLDSKANLRHKDSLDATPLTISIQHRQHASMLVLLHRNKHGCLEDVDKNGCSAVHWAAYKGDLTSLKLLDYFGAEIVRKDNTQMLPLHRAVCASQAAVIEFLVEVGCDPMEKNGDDETCVDIATRQGDVGMQQVLDKVMKQQAAKSGRRRQDKKDEDEQALVADLEAGGAKDRKRGDGGGSGGKEKSSHRAFPVFWLVCVSLAMFQYLQDSRIVSWTIAPTASMMFELGVPLSLMIFAYVALSDPGKVPPRPKGASGVEELMMALDSGVPASDPKADVTRLCTTTWVLKDMRTKYCTQTGACVQEFDHYCVWLNCAIGKHNHRPFVLLSICECITQVSHMLVCWSVARELISYQTFGSWVFAVAGTFPLMLLIFLVHCLTAPWVFMLFLHQGRLVAMNLTTNEMINAHRYPHFWVTNANLQSRFVNPFNKGGMLWNCCDFWWYRNRSLLGPQAAGKDCCSSGHCGHNHA
mmetsp:Transcript_15168/g.34563  ORF Transcript_15168/g.34563 Transcript_15168/m.34563 type:complete len:582 (-) Transcript_15168:58-1803(-)